MAILGVPFAINLFGDEGGHIAAMVLAIVVPVYNILAVTVLSIFDPSSSRKSLLGKIFKVLFGIIKNPLIISIALGGIVCAFDITLPAFADKTINYFANASTPLALIAIGASFRFSDLKGRAGLAVCGAILKTIAVPLVMLYIANTFFGFTGARLGIVLEVFGTPTAVSSYIMAKNMNSDHKLANQIVLLTTLMSAFTIFAGSFILRRLGLI
jgi:predicted permease